MMREFKITGWPAFALMVLIALGIVDAIERVIVGILR